MFLFTIIIYGQKGSYEVTASELNIRASVNKGKGIYYYEVGGKEYPIIAVAHPSAPTFCYSAYQDIQEILNSK